MYKLVALDMDGTLLKEDKTISKENLTAIEKAKENGVKFVLATGRPIKGIEKYLKQLDLIGENDYAVSFNGAVIQNTKTGEIIAKSYMNLNDLKYLYELSKKLNVNIHFLTPSSCVTPKINKYSQLESDLNNIPLEIVDFDNIDKNTTIVKIMFIDHESILDKVIKKLPEDINNRYTVLRSAPYFLEFINKEVNKGFGVKTLAKNLGINQEEIICMGDAENDIHMIKYAGLGVAMGNAFPIVKEVANYVTKTNEGHGVAHVINKFILGAEKVC
ncbi:sugar-phosphatase [Clostridiaceae bacterium UIB06]|uniref:Sugar-phosphatase n=1 Tax=Clostridium thailandense TaxID=2794346 RepID=A0A949X2U6_9CLOT|nr:sugar-phosphatase [Clostridium thailandense]MBV7271698.1 sugar-phosphatase [Clostridium thailandense]MCH5136331.1 sugar-phosphatase [Clostridiaceae bacterium UIB06]